MPRQTATKTERFARTRRRLLLGVLGVFAVLGAVVALAVATDVPVTAATSSTINFQARLETTAGSIAPDGNYNVEFKLYDLSTSSGSSQGSCAGDADCLWTETRTGANQVHVTNGYLTVNLGSVTAFPSTVNWNQQLYLTMNIGGTGGSPSWDGEMSPRLKLTAVPYAFQAGALSATSGANIGKLSFGSITGTDTLTLPDASGTVCLQGASACGFATGSGTAFLQGGNSFGAQGVLGTNDGNSLAIRTNNTNKLVIDTSGNLQLQQASTFSVASAATGSQLTIQAGSATSAGNTGGNLLLQGGAGGSGATTGSVIVKANGSDSTGAFQIQNSSSVALLTADTSNSTVTLRAGSDHATLGSELYSGTFSSGWATTGWDVSGITTAVHNTGNTNALINSSVPITSGATYRVSVTLSGTCTSTITGTIGGTQFTSINGGGNDYCTAGYTYTYVATATNTAGLTFTPDTSWAGTISNVSIKQLTGTINPALSIQNASGTANLEVRASSTTTNLFIGANSGALNATGFQNTAVGGNSLQSNLSGGWNAAFGSGALLKNTTGSDNSAFGYSSLAGNVTGTDNAAFGYQALMGNIGGTANSAFGSGALQTNISGHNNTAVGASALGTTFTGNFNTAVGDSALYQNRSGSRNAAFGSSTLGSNTSGTNNSAFGYDALASTTTGSNNVAFGDFSLEWNTTGSGNTALGHYAGFQDSGGSFSTLATLQNATAIGAYAQVQASYSIVLGSVDTATNVGIGTTVPLNRFSVSPLDYQTGTVTRTNGSATLVGTGTTWGSFAAGDLIVFADGTTNTVSTVTDATHITMGSPYSGTTDASPVSYRFHKPGFQVTALGNAYVQNTSTTAFQVQTSSGTALLTADTSGSQISVGGNLSVTGSKNVFSAAATATGTNGVLNLGPGGFGGGGGNFAGSSSGTLLALNGAAGFSGNLADLQVNGTSQFKVDASGNLTITGSMVAPGPANIFGTSAGSSSSSGKISVGAGGFSGGAGNFVGSGGGTEIAINATSSWTGNLVDFQVNGASRFLIDPNGQVVVNAPASYTGTLLSLKLNGTSVFAVGSTGHLISAGTAPTVAVSGANDCNSGATIPATASLTSATDTKGIVNLTTGNGGGCFNGGVAAVTFATAYAATPVIVLTPMTLDGAAKGPFVFFASTTGFSVCLATAPAPSTTYQFAYEVVQ